MCEENNLGEKPMPKSICFFNHKGGVSKNNHGFQYWLGSGERREKSNAC